MRGRGRALTFSDIYEISENNAIRKLECVALFSVLILFSPHAKLACADTLCVVYTQIMLSTLPDYLFAHTILDKFVDFG